MLSTNLVASSPHHILVDSTLDGASMDDLEALLAEVDSEFIDVDQWLLPLDDDATEFLSDLCSTENGTSLNDQPASSCQFNHTDCSAVTDQDADAARANSAGAIPLPRFELAQEPSLPRIDMASIANEISSLPKRSTRKQQIDDLRIQVAQLTLELRALKQTVGIDTDAPISAEAMNPSTMAEGSPVVGLWKRMALRQRELRQDAEEDQRALQHAVKTYSRRVNHLHRLIEKLSADNVSMHLHSWKRCIHRTNRPAAWRFCSNSIKCRPSIGSIQSFERV